MTFAVFNELRSIPQPFRRSMTGAMAAFSLTTIAAGTTLTLTRSHSQSAHQVGIYSALVGTGCGAVLGLAIGGSKKGRSSSIPENQPWTNWRRFVVARKVRESEEITSFYLKPEDGDDIPSFQPGQFLTIHLEIPGQNKPVIRTYSLSDDPGNADHYRLSIKRELAPKDLSVPPGIASNFMHDQVQEGSVLLAKPPSGRFVLDVTRSLPVVLISNGVGITPMISMAKACSRLNPNRPIWFLHGARDGRFHAFRDEISQLAQQSSNLHVHYAYSRPRSDDEGNYHSVGYIDAELVTSFVGSEAEYFLCGSPEFMRSLMDGLSAAGIPENCVYFESFGQPMKPSKLPDNQTTLGNASQSTVTFVTSGQTVPWNPSDGSLLELAEAHQLNPPYSCRAGICGTCMCKLRSGEVTYQTAPTADIDPGSVLICISQPKTSEVVLDI